MIYVCRDGKIVPKKFVSEPKRAFPSPMLSRMETYDSPIDGKSISSWRQRDKDLADSNSVDPRDVKVKPRVRPEPAQLDLPFWRDTDIDN